MEEKHPLVSVIMPVYNAEKTVERAIRSVQSQTCPDWELLAVDDGSADGSGAVCDRCAQEDARIRVFHTPNAGVSHARNTAMQAARGEWIAFLDSDDSYDPAFLQTMLANAADVDMVICMYRLMPAGQNVAIDRKNIAQTEARAVLEETVCCGEMHITTTPVWNRMIRRRCVTTMFDEKMKHWEDGVFVLQNWKNCERVKIIPDCLYHYFYTTGCSLSKKIDLGELKCLQKRKNAYAEMLSGSRRAMEKVISNYQTKVCYYFLKLMSVQKAKQDKLLILRLQIDDELFLNNASYGIQCRGIFRLLWRALQTQKAEWVYFVFFVLGKPYMRYQALKEKIIWRDGRK